MKSDGSQTQFRVINGNRRQLENTVMKQMAEGLNYEESLERLRPKGNLRLVYSNPAIPRQEETESLNIEDSNS